MHLVGFYYKDAKPVHAPHPNSCKSILKLSSHLPLGLPNGLFPSGFRTKPLYASLLSHKRATWPVNLIILDFMTRIIFGEQYRPLSTSLHGLLDRFMNSTAILSTR